MTDDSAAAAAASGGSSEVDDDARVLDWELGLPSADDLTPLSQSLIPPSLASAFSIAPEPQRTALDVHRASHSTVSALRRHHSLLSPAPFKPFHHDPILTDDPDPDPDPDPNLDPSRPDPNLNPSRLEDEAAAAADEDPAGPALKRPRLVWTPQLHKRFVDVVAHLGVKNAVPKTIMQMMNVEGLTRENVASHLQKYRMFLKKSQGMPGSSSDNHHHHHLFASMTTQSDLFAGMIPMPGFGHYGAYGAFGEKLNSGGSSWSMPSYHRATSGGK